MMTATTVFSPSPKPPSSCASTAAPSITCVGEARDPGIGGTAAALSTCSVTFSHGPSGVRDGRKMRRARVHRLSLLVLVLVGMGCAALLCPKANTPLLVWNASPSVPIGLYRAALRPPRTGALAILRLREPHRALAELRGYLAPRALLIKWVAAAAGDRVCRYGSLVTINGRPAAHARASDAAARPLPAWQGCTRLAAGQIFVLSGAPGSFDSRYFGPVDARDVVGTPAPVWTLVR